MKHYPHYLKVQDYPDYQRRYVRVPSWETFQNITQFSGLRVFSQEGDKLLDYKRELDLYVEKFNLGRVIWPNLLLYYAKNLPDLVAEMKSRGLFLFDIWGYGPMSNPKFTFGHTCPTKEMLDLFERELGDHFLGIDNGEQDGRYFGEFAPQMCPAASASDRREQYLHFHRHFRRMTDELGNRMTALVSLTAGHYFMKEGNTMLAGAETAQALPNSQVYYSFLRGAGKQYGVHWFGNASVFNHYGFKSYDHDSLVTYEKGSDSLTGPEAGTSLSLLKRLLWTHIMYNSVIAGFETALLVGDDSEKRVNAIRGKNTIKPKGIKIAMITETVRISPIGQIQADAKRIMDKRGRMGVHIAPLAFMLDFFSGWAMPRHNYCYVNQLYQTWGNTPYNEADHLTHLLFDLVYPGYVDSSYYRDERGYLSPTPFGDIVDTLLSDASDWVLRQYDTVVVAGAITHNCAEVADNLLKFADAGGTVILTAGNAVQFGDELTGIKVLPSVTRFEAGTAVRFNGEEIIEPHAFLLHGCENIGNGEVISDCNGMPAVVLVKKGKGIVITLLSPFGVYADRLACGNILANTQEVALPRPFLLTAHTTRVLTKQFERLSPFSVGAGLGYVACSRGQGCYEVLIINNSLEPKRFKIECNLGKVKNICEVSLGTDVSKARGYKPGGYENQDIGEDTDCQMAGLSVRLFEVAVKDETADRIRYISPPVPPKDRGLSLSGKNDIYASVLMRPTFSQHFDVVKVPWTYFRNRDVEVLRSEGAWLRRQAIRVLCDFSPGCNHFPDLTMLDNCPGQWQRSLGMIQGVFDKMVAAGAQDAIITLSKPPPVFFEDNVRELFLADIRLLCDEADARGINLHLSFRKHRFIEGFKDALEFIKDTKKPKLFSCFNAGHVLQCGEDIMEAFHAVKDTCRIVLLSTPHKDDFERLYDSHLPCASSPWHHKLRELAGCARDKLIVLDAVFADENQEIKDTYLFRQA